MENEPIQEDSLEKTTPETPQCIKVEPIPQPSTANTESTTAQLESDEPKSEPLPDSVIFATPTCTKQWKKMKIRKMKAHKRMLQNRKRIPMYPVAPWRLQLPRNPYHAHPWRLQLPRKPYPHFHTILWRWPPPMIPNFIIMKRMKSTIMKATPPSTVVKDELSLDPNLLFNSILSSDIKKCMKSSVKSKPKWDSRKKYENMHCFRLNCMDPLMLYGITLHRYANNMCEMIRVAELAIESNLIPPADAAPPIPKKFQGRQKDTTNSLHFMPKQITSFSMGENEGDDDDDLTELSSTVIQEILYQSIAAIVGLLGFETTQQSVLDVFVDVLIEFLKKISYHFKIAYEDQQRGWLQDFPNIAERVLVELGMGGARALHDYYQCRVAGYVKLLEKHCEDLYAHYNSLIPSSTADPVEEYKIDETIIKVEKEDEPIEIDTSQVQIALNEEVELPSLDAGFQLLSSLEARIQLI